MAEECAFCGHPDARHRVVDTILSRVKAGEDFAVVLDDHGWNLQRYKQVVREIAKAEELVGWVEV